MTSVMLNEEEGELESRMALTAAVMADKSRSRMLCALMDGRAWTATELSAVADVSASTASAHLARLCEQRFVVSLAQGRHRYFRLAGADIAELLECLMGVAWMSSSPRKITTPRHLRHARTCYDHLAGEVAVMLFDTLLSRQWLTPDGETLTPLGREKLAAAGIVVTAIASRRKFSCGCLDWSERRYHSGGVLGAALLSGFTALRWIKTEAGSRHVTFTPLGIRKLRSEFGINATG
ncbi:transcriptional regulator [Citrobacter amalonaticus]|uniref:Transcriptional regulator n=1 Tax=Citrobacter amalonaticus TaxID=35703 RepID=A0A2S4RYF7_CITAM|nr:winged helix-turn-helix domain-containing protein [Citrobacter amalonaticus]POT57794.1 transcriptional regulator [Citrobacter amalonaticus]POT76679.1 transcriptional regulator [Citrobacter amalonaticus]POU65758.1 transcriptional regulator [Citrobacter amalonaticus]POV05915.1 transcriptional regulator [Citrobacter amalonaticus]